MERCVVCDASILSYVHHLKSSPQCFPSNSPDVSPSRWMSMARCSVCDAAISSYEHHLKSSPQCFPSNAPDVSPTLGKSMTCSNCGGTIVPSAKFCVSCGTLIVLTSAWEDVETTEPGWYESPDNPALARYWDGDDWDEKSDSRYEVLMYEAFIESMGKQEDLLAATRAQSISQTELLRNIRTIGAWLLILAILGPIALWIATTVIVNAL